MSRGLILLSFLVAQAQPFHDPGGEVFHEDVRFGRQLLGNLQPFRVLEVQGDALLPPVIGEELIRLPFGGHRHGEPLRFALARHLHLDDLGPQLAQHRRTMRTRQILRKIQYPDAFQCLSHDPLLRSARGPQSVSGIVPPGTSPDRR